MKRYSILGVFAHPDDETFGPGATFAKYASQSCDIHILTATRGQVGQTSNHRIEKELGYHREQELRKAAKVLGIENVTVLDFTDGGLNEHQLPLLKNFIRQESEKINPDIIITYEPLGISRHLDHIAVSKAVIQLFDEGKIKPQKLYYFGIHPQILNLLNLRGGQLNEEKAAIVDVERYLPIKINAFREHKSQDLDWKRLLQRLETIKSTNDLWRYDYFELARTMLTGLSFPETDLLAGLR